MADPTNPFADNPTSTQAKEDDPFGSPQNYGQDTQPKASSGGPPAPPPEALNNAPVEQKQQQYDQGSNYTGTTNNNNNNNIAANIVNYIPQEQQNEMAYAAGTAVANNAASAGQEYANQAKQEYNNSTANQKDINAVPEPPACIIKMIQWFPLRFFAMIGGLLLIALPIVDIITTKPTFTAFFIYSYIIVFGFLAFFIEAPTFVLSRKVQMAVSFWFRLLSRTWGRAWFYLFISFLCFGNIAVNNSNNNDDTNSTNNGFRTTTVAGAYIIFIALLSFVFGRLSAKKYQRMYIYMAAGTEGDQLIGNLIRKFDELDTDQDGRVVAEDLTKFAIQAGRSLSNSERHAIQSFLDESCNGYVSKEDWMKQWTTYNLEQKML